ncbi:hypothetical protein JOM56_012296 [Amanita muscaria]
MSIQPPRSILPVCLLFQTLYILFTAIIFRRMGSVYLSLSLDPLAYLCKLFVFDFCVQQVSAFFAVSTRQECK